MKGEKEFGRTAALLCAACLWACNVMSTGGDTGGLGGEGGATSGAKGCPRGIAVVLTDYLATQVALVDLRGNTESESFISTASSQTDGLSFALSGDVVVPSASGASEEVLLIDRYGTNVLSWVAPTTGAVRAQLAVGTGFESNPQDAIAGAENELVISRWGQNQRPGREPHDDGGDLLFVDTSVPEITGSLVLPTEGSVPARPGAMLRTNNEIIVTLDRVALDFSEVGDAMFVGVSVEEREIEWQSTAVGYQLCSALLPSPDGQFLAAACSGRIDVDGHSAGAGGGSGLLFFDASARPLRLVAALPAVDLIGEPLQAALAFASERIVLLKTQTPIGGASHNRWLSLDWQTGESVTWLMARPAGDGSGKGLVYGGMLCLPGCGDICLLADADQGVLQRLSIAGEQLRLLEPIQVERRVGLPPTRLAPYSSGLH